MAGLPVYVGYKNLNLGDPWPAELVRNAANSTVLVAVITKSYNQRFWCMCELDLALRRQSEQGGRFLVIPVFVDDPATVPGPGDSPGSEWRRKALIAEELALFNEQRWQSNMKGLSKELQCASPGSDGGQSNAGFCSDLQSTLQGKWHKVGGCACAMDYGPCTLALLTEVYKL